MAEFGDDCYYYFYSKCQHGAKCQFRHVAEALGTEIVCQPWRNGRCQRRNCPYRHMSIEKNRSDIPCYWESQPGGCLKTHCVFKHLKGRKVQEADSNAESEKKQNIKLSKNVEINSSEKSGENSLKIYLADSTVNKNSIDSKSPNVHEEQKINLKRKNVEGPQTSETRIDTSDLRTVAGNAGLSEINEDVKSLNISANRSENSSGEENSATKKKIRIRRRKPDLLIGMPISDGAKVFSGSEEDDIKIDVKTKKHWRKRSRSDECANVDDSTPSKMKRSESSGKLSAEAQNSSSNLNSGSKNAQIDAEMNVGVDKMANAEETTIPTVSDDYKTKLIAYMGADLAESFIKQGIVLDLNQMS